MYFLGHKTWSVIARGMGHKHWEVDLRNTRCAYPSGLVALCLASHYRGREGLSTSIILPDSLDVLNYLERADFLRQVHPLTRFDRDTAELANNRRTETESMTEILLSKEQHSEEEIRNVVHKFLTREVSSPLRLRAYEAFDELFGNVLDHSNPNELQAPALSLMQAQVYSTHIDLALGDLGVGLLESMRTNPRLRQSLENEVDALNGALVHAFSRHELEERGGGLRRVLQVTKSLKGEMKVLSKNGLAHLRQHQDGTLEAYSIGSSFPGTLVWIKLPTQ